MNFNKVISINLIALYFFIIEKNYKSNENIKILISIVIYLNKIRGFFFYQKCDKKSTTVFLLVNSILLIIKLYIKLNIKVVKTTK